MTPPSITTDTIICRSAGSTTLVSTCEFEKRVRLIRIVCFALPAATKLNGNVQVKIPAKPAFDAWISNLIAGFPSRMILLHTMRGRQTM
jgi:hypothetical protein